MPNIKFEISKQRDIQKIYSLSKKLIAVLIGTIALTGFGISTLANGAISSYKIQQLTLNNGSKTEMNANQRDKAEEAKKLAELKKKFKEAGINLTPQQDKQIEQAYYKMFDDYEKFFDENAMLKAGKLLLSAALPEKIGGKLAESTGIGQPLATFYTSISNSLTPEQRPTWERIWNDFFTKPQQPNQRNTFKWETNQSTPNN